MNFDMRKGLDGRSVNVLRAAPLWTRPLPHNSFGGAANPRGVVQIGSQKSLEPRRRRCQALVQPIEGKVLTRGAVRKAHIVS